MISQLIVTVPIQLSLSDDGYYLRVASPTNREASINISHHGELLVRGIFDEWAKHAMMQARLKARRPTGVLDATGKMIYEGDILRIRHSDAYPSAVAAVAWNVHLGAFTLQGDTERHGPWSTPNLGMGNKGAIIGNMFEDRDLMIPAALAKMPDQD